MTGVREVDADLVGPAGQQPDFEQAESARRLHDGSTRVTAFIPSSLDGDPPLSRGGDVLVERLRGSRLDRPYLPLHASAGRSSRPRLRAACDAARPARCASSRRSAGPEVSRSRRWASSSSFACGRAARSDSITPKLTPLPPCTATPEGLSMTSSAASSYTIGNSAGFAVIWRCRATRTGGRRTLSPGLQAIVGLDPAAVDPDLRRCAAPGRHGFSARPSGGAAGNCRCAARRLPRRLPASRRTRCGLA